MESQFLQWQFLESSETVRLPTMRVRDVVQLWDAGKIVWSSDRRVPPNGLLTIAPLPSSARLGRY